MQNRWVTLLCAHVIKKLIHLRIYLSRIASRSTKFAKFESLENYALYSNYCHLLPHLSYSFISSPCLNIFLSISDEKGMVLKYCIEFN